MPLDDGGNPQIDFVWGNVPMQPDNGWGEMATFRRGYTTRPGDGEAEYYNEGHATVEEWGDPSYYDAKGKKPSLFLDGSGNHPIALRKWDNFYGDPATDGYELTVDWWEVTPAMVQPNLYGKTVEQALVSYRNLGVAENFLGDFLTNATNPYASGEGSDNGWLRDSGVVIWRYLDPEYQIGTHWDGSPWLAKEAEGLVTEAGTWPGNVTAIGSYLDQEGSPTSSDPTEPNLRAPYWLTFSVIQTTDPLKNSWNWWN
jgi:hypothetical protein